MAKGCKKCLYYENCEKRKTQKIFYPNSPEKRCENYKNKWKQNNNGGAA